MRTTVRGAGVMTGLVRIAEAARLLTEQLLQPRRVHLKERAPRERYVHQLQREIAAGRAKPIAMLLATSFAGIDDGLSSALVTQWARSYIATVEEYEAAVRDGRPAVVGNLLPKMLGETRAQSALDVAQQELLANPDDLGAIDRFLAANAAYDAKQDSLVSDVRARRVRAAVSC